MQRRLHLRHQINIDIRYEVTQEHLQDYNELFLAEVLTLQFFEQAKNFKVVDELDKEAVGDQEFY